MHWDEAPGSFVQQQQEEIAFGLGEDQVAVEREQHSAGVQYKLPSKHARGIRNLLGVDIAHRGSVRSSGGIEPNIL
jgi:hypothetical protein